jgi:hypothetical protein
MNALRIIARKATAVSFAVGMAAISCSRKSDQTKAPQVLQSEPTPKSFLATVTPSPVPQAEAAPQAPEPAKVADKITTPRERVRERFTQLFGDLRKPAVTPAKLLEAWNEFWPHEFDEELPSALKPDIAQGKQLPQELDLNATPGVPLHEQISGGNVTLAQNDRETESFTALYTLCVGACASGGRDLPIFLNARAQQLPPNRGDIAVFQILQETLPMVSQQAPMSADQVTSWVALANAPNPVYRLAALEAFARVSVDREQRLAFYRQYFDDSDPTVLKLLVDKLEALPSSQVPETLAALQSQVKQAGKDEVNEYAGQAIARLRGTQ